MHILFIGNLSFSMLNFRKSLIEKYIQNGHSVTTLTLDYSQENFEKLKVMGVNPLTYSFSKSGLNPFQDILNTISLSLKIRKIRPDSILCFFPKPVIFGVIAARLAGVNCVYALLEGLGFCFTNSRNPPTLAKKVIREIQVLLYKISLPLSKGVFFLNHDDYRELIKGKNIRIKKGDVIGGIGVDIHELNYHAPLTERIHFTMMSRLLVEKGVREFVAAADIVKKAYPYVHFSVAGEFDDNPGGLSKDEVNSWIKEGNVNFLGQISNIKDFLIDTSVYVLPSYREGVPRSTQEAMSIGRAIITTDVPGCRETVINGTNGYLVPPWNVKELANAMIRLIDNPELIVSMGKESRRIAVDKFDENKICEDFITLIEYS